MAPGLPDVAHNVSIAAGQEVLARPGIGFDIVTEAAPQVRLDLQAQLAGDRLGGRQQSLHSGQHERDVRARALRGIIDDRSAVRIGEARQELQRVCNTLEGEALPFQVGEPAVFHVDGRSLAVHESLECP